jgi:glycosyltransferase involved in cell wall biosynthesis
VSSVRILNVVPTLMCGGTENQFMTLSRELDPTRFELEFACLRRWGGFIKEIHDRGIPLAEYPVPSFRNVRTFGLQARLARHISRRRIQIVHAYNFYGNVFAVPPARLSAPVVIASIRDRGPYLTTMQKRVQRYACQFADCVLVNAEAVRDWLIDEGYDRSKIVVIPNGVELTRFVAPPQRDALRHELGLPAGTPLVAVVGRLARFKGLEQFLEATAALAPQFPLARFLITGETAPMETAYLTQLKALAERLGVADRVIFTGLRDDVPALLSSVDVSVMPSLNEALSNVLLESMAAGAPVVATRVGGTPEALTDGENGLMVPPEDPRALATAVATLLRDPALAARLGHAARQRIATQFSVDRMVQATEQLYDDLLVRKGRGASRRVPTAAA